MYAGAGDGFGSNAEVRAAIFGDNGTHDPEMAAALYEDLSLLLYPSADRALAQNRAYRQIVEEQRFAAGPTALLDGADAVFATLAPQDIETRVGTPLILAAHSRDNGCRPGMDGSNGKRYQIDGGGLID